MQYNSTLPLVFSLVACAAYCVWAGFFIHAYRTGNTKYIKALTARITVCHFMVVMAILMIGSGLMLVNGLDRAAYTWAFSWVGWLVITGVARSSITRS